MNKATRTILILVGAILGAFILFYLYGTSVYNGAVERQEAVKRQWGNVQVAYQMRSDLVPQLIASVKGARDNERAILENVTKARSGISAAQSPAELQKLGADINKAINIVFENYPEIKSTENFGALNDQLIETEHRVGKARTDYNETVENSNGYIRGFWKKKALALVGGEEFKVYDAFEAAVGTEKAPKVD
ncbi:MAG: LemA family protein, partial [Bacteroidetes bacterium]|nr:LemA family protein [Bacteroidota bacterium]